MSFILASSGTTVILLLFGLREARQIRGSHGECASRDVSAMASTRLLVWAIAMSVAAVLLLPEAHATEARVALLGADVVFGAVIVLLRRQARGVTHTLRG